MLLLTSKHVWVGFSGKFYKFFVIPMDLIKLLVGKLVVCYATSYASLCHHLIRWCVLSLASRKIFNIQGCSLAFSTDISYWSGTFLTLIRILSYILIFLVLWLSSCMGMRPRCHLVEKIVMLLILLRWGIPGSHTILVCFSLHLNLLLHFCRVTTLSILLESTGRLWLLCSIKQHLSCLILLF